MTGAGTFAKLWRDDGQVLRLTASELALFIELHAGLIHGELRAAMHASRTELQRIRIGPQTYLIHVAPARISRSSITSARDVDHVAREHGVPVHAMLLASEEER